MADAIVQIDENNSTSEHMVYKYTIYLPSDKFSTIFHQLCLHMFKELLDGNEFELKDLNSPQESPLLDILINGNEETFLIEYNTSSKENLISNKIQRKLLAYAITYKRENVVEKIVSNIKDLANDKSCFSKYEDIFKCVCSTNNFKLFEKLLSSENHILPPTTHILNSLICNLDENFFDEWFDVLHRLKKIDINEVDGENKTPLFHALWNENNTAVKKLLHKRAYIGVPKHFDNYFSFRKPLDPQLIKECFDSCLGTHFVITKKIKFNYRNLVPPIKNQANELEAIMLIINSKEHLKLLKHPLITSFMALKWHRMAKCLHINLFIYCVFSVSFVAHTIFVCKYFAPDSFFVILTWLLTIFGIIYLVIREIIQLFAQKEYLKISNLLELILIGLSITAITLKFENSFWKEIVVSTILLIVIVFCNLVENFPILFISTHMLMLQGVLKSFLKSFTLYSIFVFTFAISFYILLGVEQNKTNQSNENSPPEHSFGNFSTSFIKTMAMFIGELDFENMGLKTDFYRNFVFLLFVICMSFVLMNLLNGIAVRDIQEIKDEAELNGLICRAKFLYKHDYKLFPHHNYEEENEEEESQFCCCKYTCIVEPEHKYVPNKISLPNRCVLCYEKYKEKDSERRRLKTKQTIWSRYFRFINLRKFLDNWVEICIENPTIMESPIVKASIKVIINKEKSSSDKKNQLKDMTIIENTKTQNTIQEIFNRVENIEPNTKNIQTNFQTVEHKVQNIENQVENLNQKIQNIQLNEQIIVIKLRNIEQKYENMEKNVKAIEENIQNIGKNVEKILNNFKE